MAVWTEQLLSSLPTLRLDSEYYQPLYLKLSSQLDGLKPVKLGDRGIAYVTDGIHGSPDVVDADGIRYLSAKCVKDNFFVLDDTLQISKTQDAQNPRTRPRVGDVLVTTVGTIGNAAVVTQDILPANTDRHLGLIRLFPDSGVDPYFLATFLNTKYGRFQTLRESTGNVQLNLFIEKIKILRIPRLACMDAVAGKTRNGYAKRRESQTLYNEAENLLLKELGLADLDLSPQLFYERRYSEAAAAHRLDAEYFQPEYYRVADRLKKGARKLKAGNVASFSAALKYGTSEKLTYTEAGKPFLRIADLQNRRFDLDSVLRIPDEEARREKAAQVRTGDVLISRSGTLGIAVPIPPELDGAIFGSYFIRVRPDATQIDPEFLALYMNSLCGSLQVERLTTGGVQTNLTIPAIKSLFVVMGDPDWQKPHVEKVQQSLEARHESRRLLDTAKRTVEIAIDEGEAAALRYVKEEQG